ncbi:transcriptional activator FtrA [Halomonas chromatireducens]|uniref:Transcriptional activator FtrA n=1 Tax=Halomonas chromatireducens TaxID=507626 RepID=A0A0X8HFW0_9GAMM|nr:transcriptional activator FtrA [Halomonas chromatireducens]
MRIERGTDRGNKRELPAHRAVAHRVAIAGLEAFSLVSDRTFPRHAHDQFGVGLVVSGGHRSWSSLGMVDARAGDLITVNPGELHDGSPMNGIPRAWQMLYCDPALVAFGLEGALDGEGSRPIEFARPAIDDPRCAALFQTLIAVATRPGSEPMAIEEATLHFLAEAFRRHGAYQARCDDRLPRMARVRQWPDEAPEQTASLADLAALVGVSRYQLLRGFVRETGMTPHAYRVQRRVRMARQCIIQGQTLSQAAAGSGFADQSHMTRAFTRQLRISPGRYRAALG